MRGPAQQDLLVGGEISADPSRHRPKGGTAVMARRAPTLDELDYFPTPPWATRAVVPFLRELDPRFDRAVVWEPACGGGHMAEPLREFGLDVRASDVFDHGYGRMAGLCDFLDPQLDALTDWTVTNPPFVHGVAFARQALRLSRRGVALLVRAQFLESLERYELFAERPPRLVLQYAERVPMVKGRWDPKARSATAYCWVIWTNPAPLKPVTHLAWIPPGRREALTRPDDVRRFAEGPALPMFGGLGL